MKKKTATKIYFQQLIKQQATKDRQRIKQILYDLFECKKNVCRSLQFGDLQIIQPSSMNSRENELEAEIKKRKLMYQKQIQSIQRDLYQNQQSYRNARAQLKKKRDQQIKLYKEQQQKKNKQISQKVKKWSQQLKQSDKKRQQKFQKAQQKLKNDQQITKAIQQQKMNLTKLQRQKAITNKLKQLQQNKLRRKQQFFRSANKSNEKLPLFQQIQKKYKQLDDEKKFEQNLARKNHKLTMKIDHESIKAHQKQFVTRINQRNKRMDTTRVRAQSSQNITQFNLFTNRDQQRLIEDIQRKKRRDKFSDKVKRIPLEIDQAKRVKIEIERDKAKNPFKYAFLSQKSLNEFQIFGQFKDFAMNVDAKAIGKEYFQEMKKKVNESRVGITKSNSLNIIKDIHTDKISYRNYLDDFKMKRKLAQQDKPKGDEIDSIIKSHKNKQKVLIQLKKKSQDLQNQVIQKKKNIKSIPNYKELITKQQQMDNVYTKSLKAKLAYLQMNSNKK